mmetsp:Transcript_15351/g.31047  ORF Transcript_15351/g.31047 Transcript_15351/m.31047 type:complete len:275 (+) Transcript_15351:123-947(+)
MLLPELQSGHIERTAVGPHAAARIKIEGGEKASLRRLRSLLAQHPVGERILHAAREAAVDAFLLDPAVAAAVSLPPSKEVAMELRELFARGHCLRQLAEFSVDAQSPASQRAVEEIVASWDWDLRRIEQCIERHVVAVAGAGVLAEGDVGFINFLLARPECREVLLDTDALTVQIRELAAKRDAVLAEFVRREWRGGMPAPAVQAVVARMIEDAVSVEEAVADELQRNEACLRRAAYNNRVRGSVIAKYHIRHSKRQRVHSAAAAAAAAAATMC